MSGPGPLAARGPNHAITFDDSDDMGAVGPHHDSLVISLMIGSCRVKRVLVDTGSSTNILTLDALHGMGMSKNDLTPITMAIVGFSGEVRHSVGEITLATEAKGVNLQTCYTVMDFQSPYNVIISRPWIHGMKAVSSTYHQTIKFPTPWGVQEIRGDQEMAKECYALAIKPTVAARLA